MILLTWGEVSCYNPGMSWNKPKEYHGLSATSEYKAWGKMIQRCTNMNDPKFKNYGGRGIGVDPVWRISFGAFLKDMGTKPSKHHTLERRDPDGNYEASNCYWATWEEQENNRTNNRRVTHEGRTQTVASWARELAVNPKTIYNRLQMGWSAAEALRPGTRQVKASCAYCGKEIVATRRQLYCNARCRSNNHYHKNKDSK